MTISIVMPLDRLISRRDSTLVTPEELKRVVWGSMDGVAGHTVHQQVYRLRAILRKFLNTASSDQSQKWYEPKCIKCQTCRSMLMTEALEVKIPSPRMAR